MVSTEHMIYASAKYMYVYRLVIVVLSVIVFVCDVDLLSFIDYVLL